MSPPPASPSGRCDRQSRPWPPIAAFAAYLAMSLAAWWHLLGAGLASALPAGSADPGQEVWFLAWMPHALGSGLDPFTSHSIYAPAGVNLLANTSTEALGLLFSPLSATAGAVVAFDVAVLLAPALSALGAYVLCRRFVTWAPAAFLGGLCYGFGPFVSTDLRYGHLDLTWLVLPPLVFLALDELLVRRWRRPAVVGALLGILVVMQFFVSTEILAITALMSAAAIVVLACARPRAIGPVLRDAWTGIVVALLVSSTVLAYPAWVAIDGPRHVVGPVWPHIGEIATSLAATVSPHAELAAVAFVSGGNGSYLGVALLLVLVAGAVVLRRCAELRMALVLALVAYVASLGYRLHVGGGTASAQGPGGAGRTSFDGPLPAALLGHVPLLDSIVPERFSSMVDLFCGLALALVVDHVARRHPTALLTGLRSALALAIGALALVPIGLAAPWPYEITTPSRPSALDAEALSHLAHAGSSARPPLVVAFPDSSGAVADQMVVQAQQAFAFSLADGYAIVPGRGSRAVESPPVDALWLVFAAASLGRLDLPLSTTTRRAVRADLNHGEVSEVVVLRGARGSLVMRLALDSVLGRPARVLDGAWLWGLDHHRIRVAAGLSSRAVEAGPAETGRRDDGAMTAR